MASGLLSRLASSLTDGTQKTKLVDSGGNIIDPASTVTINQGFPKKADETAATADTNVVTVAQVGIKYADLANPSNVTMYVWFGADPAAGSQIVLRPGASWNGNVDNAASMRYKSSAAGGILDYVLRG